MIPAKEAAIKPQPYAGEPADDKENARLIVPQIVLDALHELKMAHPKTSETRRQKLEAIRRLLAKECGNDGLKFDEPCQGC